MKRYGFTLIEVMVALAVLAVLAAFVYPSYAGYVTRTRRVEGQMALVEALQLQERHRARHHTYQAFSSASAGDTARRFRWWSGRTPRTSAYELEAYACPGLGIDECVEVRATPGTARVDSGFADPDCGVLTLDSAGAQGASGAAARCWP